MPATGFFSRKGHIYISERLLHCNLEYLLYCSCMSSFPYFIFQERPPMNFNRRSSLIRELRSQMSRTSVTDQVRGFCTKTLNLKLKKTFFKISPLFLQAIKEEDKKEDEE